MTIKRMLIVIPLLIFVAACSAKQEFMVNYCMNWMSIHANPVCDGSMDPFPPTVLEAAMQAQQNYQSMCFGGCAFSSPSELARIVQITTSVIKLINYLDPYTYPGVSSDFPAILDFTEPPIGEQQEIVTALAAQAATDGICTTLSVGPSVVELAETAATQQCFVIGVQLPEKQNSTFPTEHYRSIGIEDGDTYHGVTENAGMSSMFSMGVERLPAGLIVDSIIMQHPNPNNQEALCSSAIAHLAEGGTFTIVPDPDYIRELHGFPTQKSGTEMMMEMLARCVASASGEFAIKVYEQTTPEAVRQLTGYNISKQWFGQDFSQFALPEGTPMTIFVIRRNE